MKINTKYLLLRIIISPVKLLFTVIWFNLIGFLIFFKWLKNGGQEMYYGNDFGGNLTTLIESNEALVKLLKEKKINK